jgi:hypothetical protein
VVERYVFHPPLKLGLLFHVSASTVLLVVGVLSLWQAFQSEVGPAFLLYLLPVLVALILIPVFVYRGYALRRAVYLMERDGIILRWGLREEDLPMDIIRWVRPAKDLNFPLPRLRLPGAILGVRLRGDGTQVEYLASQTGSLIIIATSRRYFAISPADPDEFLRVYHRFAEMGSFTPLPTRSVYPSFLLARVWASRPARFLLLGGITLSLVLLAVVSLVIPTHETISLGFKPDGSPTDPVPSVRLLMLPLFNSFFYLSDLLLGLFFYRRFGGQVLAYLLWGCGALTALLFLSAVYYIVMAG